jgi:uncharacterized membrane protein YcaP (DUF421 family)
MNELLVIVLIAGAVQNGMSDDRTRVPKAMAAAVTLVFWSWFLPWFSFRSGKVCKAIRPDFAPPGA